MADSEKGRDARVTAGVPLAALATASPRSWREVVRLCCQPYNLRTTVALALVVGTVLFAINQLDVVIAGSASSATVAKILVTYLVPFLVSNYGIVHATQHRHLENRQAASGSADSPGSSD